MAATNDTKAKLLRGVVQDNVDIVQGVRTKHAVKRKRSLRYWLSAGIGMAGLVYMAIPAQVVSTANTSLTEVIGTVSFANIAQTPESAAPLDSPRPLDKNAVPLAIKRIVIDPGHGGEPGAISESGLMEKEITLDVALRLRRLMEKEPYEVLLTRQTDQLVPLDKRVAFANENKGDLFVSIHVNWMEPKTLRALETYYVGPTDDPATLRLASIENKDSGYSLADYKKILEKIYVDARHDESRTLAKTIQAQLHHSLKPVNPALENRGVKTAPFVVLIGTQMPAILVEISALSNEEEVKLLTKEDYRENIALALVQGIKNYARHFNVPERKGS
jgi:N-acetylmuramoyl-L-alanine amidase